MPIVFVHGFLGGSEQWNYQKSITSENDVIFLDLPGFGLNAHLNPINKIEDFASWCLAEIKNRGIEKFDLLGHSMGGMIVQEMVSLAPERVNNLILYGTGSIGALPGRFEPIEVSMERAKKNGVESTASHISATWFYQKEKDPEYLDCLEIAKKSNMESVLGGLEAMKNWSGFDKLDKIKSKTLILWGDQDRTYTWAQVEKLWEKIPNSQLAVVPGCSHVVHLEKPELFNLLIKDFIKV